MTNSLCTRVTISALVSKSWYPQFGTVLNRPHLFDRFLLIYVLKYIYNVFYLVHSLFA